MRLSNARTWIAGWLRTKRGVIGAYQRAVRDKQSADSSLAARAEELERANRRIGHLEREQAETKDHLAAVEGENEVLRSQLKMYVLWEVRERERLEAETAMLARKKLGVEPIRDDEDLI